MLRSRALHQLSDEDREALCASMWHQVSDRTRTEAQRAAKVIGRSFQAVLLLWMDGQDHPACRDAFRMISQDVRDAKAARKEYEEGGKPARA